MNKSKIISVLTGGALIFSMTGCITTPLAQAMPLKKETNINVDLIHSTKTIRDTQKMKSVLMQIFHHVGRTPYVFAGSSLYGWDCSGMVRWMYQQFGITLPHSATAQARVGHRVTTPKIGDIVLFGYKGYSNFYHAAIYIGKGKVVNANSFAGTTIIEPLSNYKNNRIAYVRVVSTI